MTTYNIHYHNASRVNFSLVTNEGKHAFVVREDGFVLIELTLNEADAAYVAAKLVDPPADAHI